MTLKPDCTAKRETLMSYVDGVIVAVPNARKDDYLAHARLTADLFKEFGAQEVLEAWGDDVPDGKITDFRRSVQATSDETVVFSWIRWPDKETRDSAWAKIMEDPRMSGIEMPFDGKRMIYGGFEVILQA